MHYLVRLDLETLVWVMVKVAQQVDIVMFLLVGRQVDLYVVLVE